MAVLTNASPATRTPDRRLVVSTLAGESGLYHGVLLALAYVLMVDGPVRLQTNSTNATLLRDILPWGLSVYLVLLICVRPPRIRAPAGSRLVALIAALAVVQLWNPDTLSLVSGIKALRPHLEFLPLVFLGYYAFRSDSRVEGMALLLAIAGAANGAMNIVQSSLSPAQLASWGPGYAAYVYGNGAATAGTTRDASGHLLLVPPGLGASLGFGGSVAMLALPFAIALAFRADRKSRRLVGLVCLPLIVAGALTSETRTSVIGAVATAVAMLLLLSRGRRSLAPALILVSISLLVVAAGVGLGQYSSISPARLLGTYASQRGPSLSVVPTYAARFPFGAGLGTAGPGVTAHSSAHAGKLNGETEYTYLIVELGVPGLLAVIALAIVTIARGLRVSRDPRLADPTRAYLAAVTAGLIGCAVISISASISPTPPFAPFLWLSVGVIAAWLPSKPHLPAVSPSIT